MKREVYYIKRDNLVVVELEVGKGLPRKEVLHYNTDTDQLIISEASEYFHIWRHDKSLHLLLQAFADRGWIKPKHKVKKQKEKHIIEWSMSVENFYKKFDDKLIELITSEPSVNSEGVVVLSYSETVNNLENKTASQIMSPSLKTSIRVLVGSEEKELDDFINNYIIFKKVETRDEKISPLLELTNNETNTSFKRAISQARKALR
ncbi:MAG: hypothetical protein M0R38_10055 [Bacteroidia bacterium]|nr:hypothetical protein [Bacteroidia bacterium]